MAIGGVRSSARRRQTRCRHSTVRTVLPALLVRELPLNRLDNLGVARSQKYVSRARAPRHTSGKLFTLPELPMILNCRHKRHRTNHDLSGGPPQLRALIQCFTVTIL